MLLNSSKAVFTDIDGTLLKGFITIDFVNYLHEQGLFSNSAFEEQQKLMVLYKSGKEEYFSWLARWAVIWGAGISGRKQQEILTAADRFFPTLKEKIFPTAKELVNRFHSKGYLVIGVSVGAFEAIDLVKRYLLLDEIIASKVLIENGVYSSKVSTKLHLPNGKADAILDYSNKNKINLSESISIGDSEQDIEMFNLTARKIALNPNSKLLDLAAKNNYLVADYSNILDKI